jgi:hypothetical protein
MTSPDLHRTSDFIRSLSESELAEALRIATQEQAERNFFNMMKDNDGFFRCSVYRDLCEAYDLEWYNTPLDKGLHPFQSADIADLTFRVKEIITSSVLNYIAQ